MPEFPSRRSGAGLPMATAREIARALGGDVITDDDGRPQ
jgi:hypothetical protein